MSPCKSLESISAHETVQHHIHTCRCHMQSLRDLTSLLTLEREHTKEEKQQLKMMGWHLENLTASFAHIHP